jgi:hypothetical protein
MYGGSGRQGDVNQVVMNGAAWVVGCSEQRPNDVLGYQVVGVADGQVLLSRHDGATYTAARDEISSYRRSRDSMLRLVLGGVPSSRRRDVGQALIKRWNRAWGVESAARPRQALAGNAAISAAL